ncbi:MAG: PAS domain S-box protein [Nitrospirota bacterium]
MSRKNLSYAAVWLKNRYLPDEVDENWATLVYAHPLARVGKKRIPVNHLIFSLLKGKEVLLVSSAEDTFAQLVVSEKGITEGGLIIFAMGEIGVLKLFSPAKLSEEEINQLKSLIPKFTTSIEGCLSYQEALKHRDHLEELVKERTGELAESEEKFRLTFENARDAIFLADPQTGLINNCNKAAELLLEKKREEIIGFSQTKVHPPEKAEAYADMFRKHIEHKGWAEDEAEVITKSGKIIPVLITATVTLIKEKPIIQGIFRDITEHKQADDNLKLHENRLADLLNLHKISETSKENILNFSLQACMRAVQSSHAFIGFMNDDESVLTVHIWSQDVMEQCKVIGEPLEFPVAEAGIWAEAIRQRTPLIVNDYEAFDPRKKGIPEGHVPIKRVLCVPAFDKGRIVAVGAVANKHSNYNETDVNAISLFLSELLIVFGRKQAEEALCVSEEKYRNLADRANDGICIIQDTLLKYMNPCSSQTMGYSMEEMLNTPFMQYIHPDALAKVTDMYYRRMAGEEVPQRYEAVFKHKDGHRIEVEVNAGIITYENRPADLVYVHDLTEHKQMEKKLIEAEKLAAVAQIASEVAHEIKNPLTVIKAGVYYLNKILPKNAAVQKTISQMDEATQRVVSYLNDLLNFARPPVLVLKSVDVHKIIEDSINELPKEILGGIEIAKDFAPDVPLLPADPDRLKQVFVNLIKNGAEAMEEVKSKKLKVKSEKEGEFVKISVSDTGKGVAEEDLKRIFDPFFTTKGKGTGLGLAICQRIVEAHKGGIEVKSTVGKGTIFVVKLPS